MSCTYSLPKILSCVLGASIMLLAAGCQQTPPPAEKSALPTDQELQQMLDDELTFTLHKRDLDGKVNAAWQILHGSLGYGRDFEIVLDSKRVKALDWAMAGGDLKGWVLRKDEGQPGVTVVVEPGTKTGQGHPDQWLAVIAQCKVPSNHPIKVGDETFEIQHIVLQAMRDIFDGKEASWTVIALSNYLDLDSEWEAGDGSIWTIERIVAMEAAADMSLAACGGTHRLAGLTLALQRYQAKYPDVKLERGWKAAKEQIDEAVAKIEENQLPSGAFSVSFLSDSTDTTETSKHLHASGHTLEFLALAMTDEQLRQPWVKKNVEYLCKLLRRTRSVPSLECGALYHAVRGLRVYRERVYGPYDYFQGKPGPAPEAEQAEVAAATTAPVSNAGE